MFSISATRRSSFAKSSNWIVVTFSIVLFGISVLLSFGLIDSDVSIFVKRIGAFLIWSLANTSWILSAVSGMKGDRSFAICLIDSTSW